jgi:acyl carrier protein
MNPSGAAPRTADKGSLFGEVQRILVESLGVDEGDLLPEATLRNDLGAESIDFLDIAFRLEEELGVRMPMKEWAKATEDDSSLSPERLALRLERVFQIRVDIEEAGKILKQGIEPFLPSIERRFSYVLLKPEVERLCAAVDATLTVKEFAARQIELFTVQSLVNFVAAALPPAGHDDGRGLRR